MMATRTAPTPYVQKPGRVFVGNIPMYSTEEELASACSVFGPVVSFKLITDKNTGKHKGYGFCEFRDEATALSAHRNQKGLLCQGRQLRVGMVHTAEERRKHLANKVPTTATNNIIKEQKVERRELDVFALRQLMKLRQAAMASKSNPKKRENGSTGVAVAGPPAKKPNILPKLYIEDDRLLRQAGSCSSVPTAGAVVLEYGTSTKTEAGQAHYDDRPRIKLEIPCTAAGPPSVDRSANHMQILKTLPAPAGGTYNIFKKERIAAAADVVLEYATSTKAVEGQTHHLTTKENPWRTGCFSDQLANNHKAASPAVAGSGIKKELDMNINAAAIVPSTARLHKDLQPDLIALLHLLEGASTSTAHHHQLQHINIGEPMKHSLHVASAA